MNEALILQQLGVLSEAVNTLKAEVTALRQQVADLSQARASVKFVLLAIGAMISLGAGISEIVHIWTKP